MRITAGGLVNRPSLGWPARSAVFLSRCRRNRSRGTSPTSNQGRSASGNSRPNQLTANSDAAGRIILQRIDLPFGFKALPGWETDPSSAEGLEDARQKIRSSLDIPPGGPVVSRASDIFVRARRSGFLTYQSEVDIYEEEADAAAELAALRGDDAGERLASLFVSQLPPLRGDFTFTQPESIRLTPPVGTDEAYGWRVVVIAEFNDMVGVGMSLTGDVLGFVKDNTIIRLEVLAVTRQIKDVERNALFVKLVRRVQANAPTLS